MRYLAFGSCIESDFDLGPLPTAESAPVVVSLQFSRVAELPVPRVAKIRTHRAQARDIETFAQGHDVYLQIEGLLQFHLEWKHDVLSCVATPEASDTVVRYWILQHALPVFLLLSGRVDLLHAGAVVMDDSVVGFLAESGVGKSTLVGHFLSYGHQLCTDEHLALVRDKEGAVAPAIPYYRPGRDTEDLGRFIAGFSPEPRPLRALYLLQPAPAEGPVMVEELRGIAAASVLLEYSQCTLANPKVPSFRPILQRRFEDLTRLSTTVPVRVLRVPRALDRLPEVYQHVCQDLGLKGAAH
ncbi:MAG: hypothetical protein QJR10_13570 [Bacillota bacterium]|jgi:hypothetical protein|nr:hypothetical protein [Bacillota bacterium]